MLLSQRPPFPAAKLPFSSPRKWSKPCAAVRLLSISRQSAAATAKSPGRVKPSTHGGVAVLGPLNVPSTVPFHASQMLSSNITAFLRLIVPEGNLAIDGSDEIIRETLVTHEARVVHPASCRVDRRIVNERGHSDRMTSYEIGIWVFMLAAFLGFELIRRVSPLLHTPLMSLTNAISAIAVVGAIIITGEKEASTLTRMLGFIAVVASTVNFVSGYLITDRMLKMFKKREPESK